MSQENRSIQSLQKHIEFCRQFTIDQAEHIPELRLINFYGLYRPIREYAAPERLPLIETKLVGRYEYAGNDEHNDNCLNTHKQQAITIAGVEIMYLEKQISKQKQFIMKPTAQIQEATVTQETPKTSKSEKLSIAKKCRKFALDRADNVLNGIHFVAISTANLAEEAKCRLHHDEDKETVKKEMMLATCQKQVAIMEASRRSLEKVQSIFSRKPQDKEQEETIVLLAQGNTQGVLVKTANS